MLGTAAIISLAGGVIGGAVNLAQAAKARERQEEADEAAGRLMAEAKSKLQKDFYEGLKLPTDAYDQAYKSNAQTQRQNIEALQQADSRTLAAGVGRVGALANQTAEQTRAQQSKDMFSLEKLKAEGKENMTQQLAQMDVAAAQDQAKRAAQADEQAGALQGAAVSSFVGGAIGAAQAQPLQSMSGADRRLAKTFDDNSKLFANNNISRSEFLNNPDKYKMLTSGLMIPTNTSGLLDQPQYPSFEPKLDYAFSANDRLQSLMPPEKLNLEKELQYDMYGSPI
tara:strand:+ start:33 stop:878 length:846 start_codon:yes stop_codon:yes gene_type:complete